MKLLTPQFSLFLSHVIFTKYVIQKSTLRRLLQFSPPLRFMTPNPNCLLLATLHFSRKRNTRLLTTDNSGMEPSMLTGKKACLLLYIRSSSERTTRKLKSNRFPSHSSPLYSYKHTYTYLLQCTTISYGCLFSIRVSYFLKRFFIYSLRFFDSFNFGIYGEKLVRQERDSEGLKSVLPLDLANYRSGNLIKREEQGISIPYTTQSAYFTAIESRKDFLYIFVASIPRHSCWLGRERACSSLK